MRTLRLLILAGLFMGTISSCRKKADPAPVSTQPTALKVEFSNIVGNEAMVLSDKWYVNEHLDSFKINTYKYYISNVRLTAADGSTYIEPKSYHLINQADNDSKRFVLNGLPEGSYTSISFMIGVDSAHNTSGAQEGALSPDNGMIWTWNTGYIMAKMEGESPSSGAVDHSLIMHIAGFSGGFNVLKNVTLNFPEAAKVSKANIPNVHIFSDALEWFKTPTVTDFASDYYIMTVGKKAKTMSDNYADMFHVDHVDN